MQKYRIESRKGEGTFSEVMKGENIATGHHVAIKMMKTKFDSIDQVRRLRELQALHTLRPHDNIIPLHEALYDKHTGRLALVFELMDMNAYELISQPQSSSATTTNNNKNQQVSSSKVSSAGEVAGDFLPVDVNAKSETSTPKALKAAAASKSKKEVSRHLDAAQVCHFVYCVLKAVEHSHKHGIFHRDIKPENILVSRKKTKVEEGDKPTTQNRSSTRNIDSSPRRKRSSSSSISSNTRKLEEYLDNHRVKLADFGSCRGILSGQPYTEYISTRWYRAPECLLTDGYYHQEMDMWGVGCVMFEVMALYPLFPGSNETDTLQRIHRVLGAPTRGTLERVRRWQGGGKRGHAHLTRHIDTESLVRPEGDQESDDGDDADQETRHRRTERFVAHLTHKMQASLMPGEAVALYGDRAIDLLVRMLTYHPADRLTAEAALQHPYFDEIRALAEVRQGMRQSRANSEAANRNRSRRRSTNRSAKKNGKKQRRVRKVSTHSKATKTGGSNTSHTPLPMMAPDTHTADAGETLPVKPDTTPLLIAPRNTEMTTAPAKSTSFNNNSADSEAKSQQQQENDIEEQHLPQLQQPLTVEEQDDKADLGGVMQLPTPPLIQKQHLSYKRTPASENNQNNFNGSNGAHINSISGAFPSKNSVLHHPTPQIVPADQQQQQQLTLVSDTQSIRMVPAPPASKPSSQAGATIRSTTRLDTHIHHQQQQQQKINNNANTNNNKTIPGGRGVDTPVISSPCPGSAGSSFASAAAAVDFPHLAPLKSSFSPPQNQTNAATHISNTSDTLMMKTNSSPLVVPPPVTNAHQRELPPLKS